MWGEGRWVGVGEAVDGLGWRRMGSDGLGWRRIAVDGDVMGGYGPVVGEK